MSLQKITASEPVEMSAFVVTDLDGADRATGVVRCAKKVLQDGAKTMARAQTYAWAVLGEQISGASAGISVEPADRSGGITTFIDGVLPRVQAGELSLDAAKGVGRNELSALSDVDVRSALRSEPVGVGTLTDDLLARGALAAAAASLGGLDGRTIAIEGVVATTPGLLASLLAAAGEHGALVVAIATTQGTLADSAGLDPVATTAAWAEHGDKMAAALGSELSATDVFALPADVLLCGSKLGIITHEIAETLAQQLVVPIAAAPVTAKGLAVADKRQIIVLADFVTTSGPLFLDHPADGTTADAAAKFALDSISATTEELSTHAEGPYLGACYRAEEYLRTWQDKLPFGRPLA